MTTSTLIASGQDQKAAVRLAAQELIRFMNEQSKIEVPTLAAHYEISGGRKYLRISEYIEGAERGVHCFIDAANGDVYMPASYAKPMLNGARYNLLDQESYSTLKASWSRAGGYLYKGFAKTLKAGA